MPLVYNFPNANYYLFEPLKLYNDNLIAFNKKYNVNNFEIFNVALSNKVGETDFFFIKEAPISSSINNPNEYWSGIKKDSTEKIKVSVNTLSNFKDKVDFNNSIIKIDTQGNEIDVLKGIDDDIYDKAKFFILEIAFHKRYEKQCSFDDVYMLKRKRF